jgi:N-acyl-D-aspartate/D-glutamate deacylase
MNDPKRQRYIFDYSTQSGQLEAVSFFGHNIRFIKNPSQLVKMTAVKQNGRAIYYINEPDQHVQMAAIENNPYSVYDIACPTDSVKEVSMKHDISIREYFSNKKQKKEWNNKNKIKVDTTEHLKLLDTIMEEIEDPLDIDTNSTTSN